MSWMKQNGKTEARQADSKGEGKSEPGKDRRPAPFFFKNNGHAPAGWSRFVIKNGCANGNSGFL